MDTNIMELNRNEMETVVGGGLSDIFRAMSMAWDIYLCEKDCHEYEWQGELGDVVYMKFPWLCRKKILVCTKCGKKKEADQYKIVV